jgi:hypothetical protein
MGASFNFFLQFSDSLDGSWAPVPIIGVDGRRLSLKALPTNAKLLAYASLTTPCFNTNCSIYDPQGLPLQPLVIQVTNASAKPSFMYGLVFVPLAVFISN